MSLTADTEGAPRRLPTLLARLTGDWPLIAPMGLLFVGFFLGPLVLLVWVSLHNDQDMTVLGTAMWVRFLSDPFYWNVVFDTLMLGFKTVALALVLGFATGLIYLSAGPRARSVLTFVIVLPLLLSVVVRTFAWIVILGNEGLVNSAILSLGLSATPLRLLQTELGLVISLAQIELPLMLLPLLSVMGRIDPNLIDASVSLGASRWRTMARVILPLSVPGLIAGSLLVFASSTAAFISQSVIGGGRLIYMPLVIWQQALVVYDWPFAAVVSLALLITVLGVLALISALGRLARN
ncbi:ABC transporter permease [Acuticoccus sp. I52.16.1]|uniref:ABC transporter permease n=1 Tax=Acuticoccus sp. I52.16.1 TaxID=2928472 RepID=UPI001FD4E143|nr:ABC transporter permease [Acuticoccus sp. I52.16.1]UOM34881.1 ABC transporter permease [Acuticoccus sp. I52.16.1]